MNNLPDGCSQSDIDRELGDINTDYWPKPIPIRDFDWTAVEDGYEPPMPVGHGRTEADAIADLQEQLEDRK